MGFFISSFGEENIFIVFIYLFIIIIIFWFFFFLFSFPILWCIWSGYQSIPEDLAKFGF
jgi:hypothetical protein